MALAGKAQAVPPPATPVQSHVLPNGMRVVLAPDPSLADVSIRLRYAVGSADDPPGKPGLAHVVEHLMYSAGSKHVGPGDYFRWVMQAGATHLNGETSLDETTYHVTVPPDALPLVFWLESDRAGVLAERIDARALEHELTIVRDEERDRRDHGLSDVSTVGWNALFPEWHPYHQSGDPTGSLTVEDVRAFLRTWYVPQNASLVVAGPFDADQVELLVEKYFGDLPAGATPPARPNLPATWRIPDVRIDVGANADHDAVLYLCLAPAYGTPEDAALDLSAAILADPHGRLASDLVARGLASSVFARESSHRRVSVFEAGAEIAGAPSVNRVEAVRSAIARTMDGLIDEGIRRSEADRARRDWSEHELYFLETSHGRAEVLAGSLGLRSIWDVDRYDAIQPADVIRAARRMRSTATSRCTRSARSSCSRPPSRRIARSRACARSSTPSTRRTPRSSRPTPSSGPSGPSSPTGARRQRPTRASPGRSPAASPSGCRRTLTDLPARVVRVTAPEVRAVAQRYLAPSALRIVLAGRRMSSRELSPLGFGEAVPTDAFGRPGPAWGKPAWEERP
ncbi:MAG: insulinase family protein [Myxococcales bacterium]|nr:insulinase family protein [Myxococcales bacterium]